MIFANIDNSRFALSNIIALEILWFDFYEESYISFCFFLYFFFFFFTISILLML